MKTATNMSKLADCTVAVGVWANKTEKMNTRFS